MDNLSGEISSADVDRAYRKYSRGSEGRKEDYFALLYLHKKFELSYDAAASIVAFGGNDYGIDAFYYDKENKSIFLYQFKYSPNHMLFKESFIRLIKFGLDRIFGNPYQDKEQNQLIIKLKTCISENQNSIDKVFIHFVFDGDPEKAEQSKVLGNLREDLDAKASVINNFFGKEIGFIFQYISNQRALSRPIHKKKSYKYELESEKCTLELVSGDNQFILNFIPLSKLLEMYNDLGEKLFDKNIRSGLDEGKATNREILKSLKKILSSEEPVENFAFYHNGVSLSAEKIENINDKLLLTEPRILNGAQTVMCLKRFSDELKADKRIQGVLEKIKVTARIIKSNDDDFLKKVTINNNRQNPIMPWNLRANDMVQLEFEDKFREELSIFYERRENAFANMTDDDLEQIGLVGYKAVEIKKFAQTLLAIQGEVDKMSEMKEVFENQNYYDNTFREKYLSVGAERLLLFYKIQYRLPSIIREIESKGEYKYYYISKCKNLLWALLIQAFLNDKRIKENTEKYGKSLVIESEFTELLKDYAKKIRFVLSKTFKKAKYLELIDEEKYSFLKTRTTFNDCMESARKLYKWNKVIS